MTVRRLRLARLALAAVLAAVLAVAALAADARDARPAAAPSCLGAASRDPLHPCANPALRLRVAPTPAQARSIPNFPCAVVEQEGDVAACAFGAPAAQARAAVALAGDSHAINWRPAFDPLARARGWQALSIIQSSCPLSLAEPVLPEPRRTACRRWQREMPGWLARHPEIGTLFMVAHRGASVVAPRGVAEFEARVRGFLAMFAALPASVRHVVVIRDAPVMRSKTPACVKRAIARRRPAGTACAVPRAFALKPDAAVVAARRLHRRRVQVVDLSPFFCDARRCFPVVGGVLTHKDVGHLTVPYVATLAPYLRRAVQALTRGWSTPA